MGDSLDIRTVDASNVDDLGFFCQKSKRKSAGWRRKRDWLQERFAEGLRLHIAYDGGHQVGFIEYIPGEFAWRAVHAPNYLVIHCLWVIGRSKGKGFGSRLVDMCLEDARQMGKHGVAVVASTRPWLARPRLFLHKGFERVDRAPAAFELLVKRFGDYPPPAFPQNWDARLARCGAGLTVVRSDQCPYLDEATQGILRAGRDLGLATEVIDLRTAQEARDLSPSAYGVFGVVHDGRLLSYQPIGEKSARACILGAGQEGA